MYPTYPAACGGVVDLLGFKKITIDAYRHIWLSHSEVEIKERLLRLSDVTREYLMGFLTGNRRETKAYRHYQKETQKAEVLESVKAQADTAWQDKKYGKAAELYGKIADNLSDLDCKRYQLALKQIGKK